MNIVLAAGPEHFDEVHLIANYLYKAGHSFRGYFNGSEIYPQSQIIGGMKTIFITPTARLLTSDVTRIYTDPLLVYVAPLYAKNQGVTADIALVQGPAGAIGIESRSVIQVGLWSALPEQDPDIGTICWSGEPPEGFTGQHVTDGDIKTLSQYETIFFDDFDDIAAKMLLANRKIICVASGTLLLPDTWIKAIPIIWRKHTWAKALEKYDDLVGDLEYVKLELSSTSNIKGKGLAYLSEIITDAGK